MSLLRNIPAYVRLEHKMDENTMLKDQIIEELNRAYFSEECHEMEVLAHFSELLGNFKVFADIGASLGQYTFHANKHMKNGIIYAFEADPMRFDELEKNCKKWESLSTNRLMPIHAAVSDTEGIINFYITNSNLSGGIFVRDVPNRTVDWETVRVNSVRLDSFFEKTYPDLLKIDVEGTELSVLKGAETILQQYCPSILVEIHSFSGQVNPADVFTFMGSKGYYSKNFFGRLLFVKSVKNSIWDQIMSKMMILMYKTNQSINKLKSQIK